MTTSNTAISLGEWRPRVWFVRAREWLALIPMSLFLLVLRVGVALIFFTSGRIKLITWDFTIRLFTEEFKLPVIPPDVAAVMALIVELTFPPFLIIGFAARLATLPLLGTLAVIQVFVYPDSWPDTLLWGGALLLVLSRGPGAISIDHLIERTIVTGSVRLAVLVLGLLLTAAAVAMWYFSYNDVAHAGLSCLFLAGPDCAIHSGLSPVAAWLPYTPVLVWAGLAVTALGVAVLARSSERQTIWS